MNLPLTFEHVGNPVVQLELQVLQGNPIHEWFLCQSGDWEAEHGRDLDMHLISEPFSNIKRTTQELTHLGC